jgi:hypothetical protein
VLSVTKRCLCPSAVCDHERSVSNSLMMTDAAAASGLLRLRLLHPGLRHQCAEFVFRLAEELKSGLLGGHRKFDPEG